MRKSPELRAVAELISTALQRGVVTDAQAQALTSLAAELDGSTDAATRTTDRPSERRRAFNPVIIAYAIGALLVVFA